MKPKTSRIPSWFTPIAISILLCTTRWSSLILIIRASTIKKGYWLSFKERFFQAFINGSSRLQRSETRDFDILVPLSLQWLDLEEYDYVASKIEKEKLDKYLLGGTNNINIKEEDLPSESLWKALREIALLDEDRAIDVLSFYVDLDKCIKNITKHMRVNSYQFWVVGNRTVKKVNIPTNKIISELGAKYGLKTVINISRNISNKRMPKENSPTNVKGEKVTTMTKENIVVLRKER